MKKILLSFIIISLIYSCDVIQKVATDIEKSSSSTLSQQEVANGLKDALVTGVTNAVNITGKTNGFYNNSEIKIPFPEEAIKIKEICEKAGLKSQVTKFEEMLNRAAETAATEAKDVFSEAIKQMTFTDAISILKGGDDAATQYLKKTTSTKLHEKFYPVVKNSTEKVMLTKYWTPLVDKYNAVVNLTGGQKLNPDLNEYITNKAMDGLFTMIAKEEKSIRTDPAARVNDILKKVFGSSLNPNN